MATWCGPCKVLAPKLEAMSKSNPDVVFLKVDVDKLEVGSSYRVVICTSLPILRSSHV